MGRFVAALALAYAALAVISSSSARANCVTEVVEMPVVVIGSRAIATVGINGTTVPLVVDSGGFHSMLTADAVDKLDLETAGYMRIEGIGGETLAPVVRVDKLRLLKSDFDDVQFVVLRDTPSVGTMGLMGRNILSFTDIEYDLAHSAIRLHFPNDECAKADMAYWAGSSPVSEIELDDAWFDRKPVIRAKVKLNEKEISAVFDTGASTLVTKRAARRAGVGEADLQDAGLTRGIGPEKKASWTAPFARFELGGEVIRNNRLRVADFDLDGIDMLLGIEFFLSHRIYISKKQSRMFFTYNGGPVFAMDFTDVQNRGIETSAALLSRRALVMATAGNAHAALTDLDAALALDEGSTAVLVQRGGMLEAMKLSDQALIDYEKALALDPALVEARIGRARLRGLAKDGAGEAADLEIIDRSLAPESPMRLAIAQMYLDLDQPTRAIPQLTQWLSTHPKGGQRGLALNNRCWSRVRLGIELDQALSDCDDAVYDSPKSSWRLDSRGWAYLRLGKDKKALADFDSGLAIKAGRAWSLYGRGFAKRRLGDAAQGDADFAAARESDADIDRKVAKEGLCLDRAVRCGDANP